MARAFLLMQLNESENRRQNLYNEFRRSLRSQTSYFVGMLSEYQFIQQYRLSKSLFYELCSELAPYLPQAVRRTKVSVECKVLTALAFYATGSYQKLLGMSHVHSLSQPSISRIVREVTLALNNINITNKYIRFPQDQHERQIIINGFSEKFGFPGVLGCIDCTHVALVRPQQNEERYFNRKHYHSRNVQIICDSNLNIIGIDATFGGATHDAYIFRNSEIDTHMQHLYDSGERLWLLGDSGYPLRPWLLTPITNTTPETPEGNYTLIHGKTRNSVERCIGVLKARWRCLLSHRVLHYDPHIVAKIINSCAVLHNIANNQRLPLTELTQEEVNIENSLQYVHGNHSSNTPLDAGRAQRQIIVNRLWSERM